MRLLWYFFIYFSLLFLHVSGFYQPIIRGVHGVHGSHHNEPVRRPDTRRQTTKHYMNQVVAHKQQLKIPLMMGG